MCQDLFFCPSLILSLSSSLSLSLPPSLSLLLVVGLKTVVPPGYLCFQCFNFKLHMIGLSVSKLAL